MLAPYIDIHSHGPIIPPHQGIESFHINEITKETILPASFSVGLHPWFIKEKEIDRLLNTFKSLCKHNNLKAIGECGLDRVASINFGLQKDIFIYQLEIAEKMEIPIIVHNVRAFSDMLEILKKKKPRIPIIFHAYSGNEDILKKLLHFNVYFSFGHLLSNKNSKASRVIAKTPLNCMFFETDDWEGGIEDIYELAAIRLDKSVIELRNQIYYTYKSLFL